MWPFDGVVAERLCAEKAKDDFCILAERGKPHHEKETSFIQNVIKNITLQVAHLHSALMVYCIDSTIKCAFSWILHVHQYLEGLVRIGG